jgi:arabinofuranosyltransferase
MTARRLPLVPLAVAAGVALAFAMLALFVRDHAYRVYDDAFIYLRYVKNVRAGCGLRFNCDDPPVEGFTSPVYLALLVAGSLVTTRLLTLTQIVCTAAVAATLVAAIGGAALRWAGEPEEEPRDPTHRAWAAAAAAVAVALVLGLDHHVLANAVLGLETPVTAFVVTMAGLAVLTDRRRLAVSLAVASFLCRPECLLLVVLLPLLPWARTVRVVAVLAGSVLAVTLVRWLVFHDFVPNTYWAKAGGTLRHLELGAAYIGEVLGDHFPFIVLSPLALLVRGARRAVTYVLAVSAAWFAFFLRTGGDVFLFGRLAFPLVPLLTVLAARGVAEAARRAARTRPAVAIGVLPLVAGVFAARAAYAHHLPTDHGDPKVIRWTALGEYLRDRYPGKTVATVPIGAIAYYSRLHVIDMLGLTTPAIARAGRTLPPELLQRNWIGHERHCLECVLDARPDLVVTTQFRAEPWTTAQEARAGFYAEWLFVRAVKEGAAPYHVVDAPIAPDVHFLVFQRDGE